MFSVLFFELIGDWFGECAECLKASRIHAVKMLYSLNNKRFELLRGAWFCLKCFEVLGLKSKGIYNYLAEEERGVVYAFSR